MGQKVTEPGFEPFTLQVEQQDGEVGISELGQNLEADSAGG